MKTFSCQRSRSRQRFPWWWVLLPSPWKGAFGVLLLGMIVIWQIWLSPACNAGSQTLTRFDLATRMEKTLEQAGVAPHEGASAPLPTDLSHGQRSQIQRVLAFSLMAAYPDSTFRPDVSVHQSELAAAWARLVRLVQRRRPDLVTTPSALPLPRAPAWILPDLLTLVEIGLDWPAPVGEEPGPGNVQTPEARPAWSAPATLGQAETLMETLLRVMNPAAAKPAVAAVPAPLPSAPSAAAEVAVVPAPESDDSPTRVSADEFANDIEEPLGDLELDDGTPEPLPTRFGQVVDSLSGRGLANAQVTIDGHVVALDGDGRFPVSGAEEDDRLIEIFAAAGGYQSLLVRFNPSRPQPPVIRLRPQRAQVYLDVVSLGSNLPVRQVQAMVGDRVVVGQDGRIRLPSLPSGYYQVGLSAPGYAPASVLVYVGKTSSVRRFSLRTIQTAGPNRLAGLAPAADNDIQ